MKKAGKIIKNWAGTAAEAATSLKVSRLTLRRWVDLEGSPGRIASGKFDLRAWRHWMRQNREKLIERQADTDLPAPLSRKKQIEIELAEIALKKAQRENAEAENRTMTAEEVDGLIFEVLANFDFHLSNAERELALKMASRFKLAVADTRKVVKPCFDGFRSSWKEARLPDEAKKYLNEWFSMPESLRARIMDGKFKGKRT